MINNNIRKKPPTAKDERKISEGWAKESRRAGTAEYVMKESRQAGAAEYVTKDKRIIVFCQLFLIFAASNTNLWWTKMIYS